MNRQNELRGVATVIVLMVLTVLLALGVVLLSRTLNRDKVNSGNNEAITTTRTLAAPDDPLTTGPEETEPVPALATPEPAPEETAAPPPPLPPPPPPPVPSAIVDPKSLPPEG